MPDSGKSKMRWYDGADMTAAPVGLAVFVIAAIALFVAGLGIYSLLTAVALGTAAFNMRMSRTVWNFGDGPGVM